MVETSASGSFSWIYEYTNYLRNRDSSTTTSDSAKTFSALCMACRIGDYELVDLLLTLTEIDMNQEDEWNNSPLLLASICGHYEVVELLLSRGALCDRDTHQGARCVYGALNNRIRDLLISYNISKAVIDVQPYAAHIASFVNFNLIVLKDIVFEFLENDGYDTDVTKLFSNRFLMAARSKYFHTKLTKSWNSQTSVEMSSEVNKKLFKIIIDYLYLKQDLDIDDGVIHEPLVAYAQKLELYDLIDYITMIKSAESSKTIYKIKNEFSMKFAENARNDFKTYLNEHIFSNCLQVKLILQDDIDFEDIDISELISDEQRQQLFACLAYPDIIIAAIDIDTESIYYYPGHKMILSRSEYFDTMFKSKLFDMSQGSIPLNSNINHKQSQPTIDRTKSNPVTLPLVHLSSCTSYEVAESLLTYLYYDDVPDLKPELAIELLTVADELFIEKLKTICCTKITSLFPKFNYEEFQSLKSQIGYDGYELLQLSWSISCDRISQPITKTIAYNIQYIYQQDCQRTKLLNLIKESASMIQERQETDTIELVDEIRFYLSRKYFGNRRLRKSKSQESLQADFSSEYEHDLTLIDSLLLDLLLDA